MPWDNVLAVALGMGLFGLVLLIVLWPGEKHGRRLLRRWGVQQPSDVDVAEAVRYLKRRRVVYPWLFLLVPLGSDALGFEDDTAQVIVWTVLLGGLLGELFALRPERGPRRQAMLTRRTVRDVVPVWALVLLALSVGGGLVRYGIEGRWPAFGVVAGCGLVAGVVIALAVRRPAAGDPVVDLVLRARSARVATGLAIGLPCAFSEPEMTFAAFLVGVLGLAALLAVVGPHKDVAAAAR